MKIKTLTSLSGSNFAFSRNTEYNVEPNLALSLIASGHAIAAGEHEQPQFPIEFPHRIKLYHRGYTTPQSVIDNLHLIAGTKGLGVQAAKEIEIYAANTAPAPLPTLPKDLPHAATLIEQGITSIEQLQQTTAAQLAFLSPAEIAEINNYLNPDVEEDETKVPEIIDETKSPEPPAINTTENPAPAQAENAAKKTNKSSKGRK